MSISQGPGYVHVIVEHQGKQTPLGNVNPAEAVALANSEMIEFGGVRRTIDTTIWSKDGATTLANFIVVIK